MLEHRNFVFVGGRFVSHASMPSFVKSSTNFWNLAFWNKTSRAWTGTKVANHGKECSIVRRPSEKLSAPKKIIHSLFWIVG